MSYLQKHKYGQKTNANDRIRTGNITEGSGSYLQNHTYGKKTVQKEREPFGISQGEVNQTIGRMQPNLEAKSKTYNKYESALDLYRTGDIVDLSKVRRKEGISEDSSIRNTRDEDRKNFTPYVDEFAYKLTKEGDYAAKNPIGGLIGYVGAGIGSGIEGALNVPQQLITGNKADASKTKNAFREKAYAEGLKRSVQNAFGGKEDGITTKGENVTGFLADTGLSTVGSAAKIATGAGLGAMTGVAGVGLGLMAAGAANSTLSDLNQNENLGARQAAAGAATHGAIEAITENVSLGNLKGFKNLDAKNMRGVLKAIGKQMIVEGSEEMASEIGNSFIDRAVLGNEAEFYQNVQNYMNSGMSKKAAKNQAYIDLGKSTLLAGLGGAISGGFMGGGATALNYAGKSIAGRNGILKDFNTADDYRMIAESVSDETEAGRKAVETAKDYENRLRNGESVTNAEKAELESLMYETTQAENAKYGAGQYDAVAASIDTDRNHYTDSDAYERVLSARLAAENLAKKEAEGKEITPFEKSALRQMIDEAGGLIPNTARSMEVVRNAEPIENVKPFPAIQNTQTALQGSTSSDNASHSALRGDSERFNGMDELFTDISKNYDKNGEEAFKNAYEPGMDLGNYARVFNKLYNSARYGLKREEVQTADLALASERMIESAFKAGVKDREAVDYRMTHAYDYDFRSTEKAGGLIDAVPDAPKVMTKAMDTLGKATGISVYITNSNRYNGSYNTTDDSIVIDLAAENPLATFTHEATHWLKKNHPHGYIEFRDSAVNSLVKNGLDLDAEIERYQRAYKGEAGQELSREEAVEEIVADSTGKFLNDKEFAREIAENDLTMAEKVVNWLKSVIKAIEELISDRGLSRSAKYLAKDLAEYGKARDIWVKEIEFASESFKVLEAKEKENTEGIGERLQIANLSEATPEKMEENYRIVAGMIPALHLTGNEFMEYSDTDKLAMDEQMYLKSKSDGGVYRNPVIGNIEIVRKGVKSDIAHGVGWVKRITIAAIPDTIKRGKLLQIDRDWKNRGYDSLALGNKVTIDAGENAGDYFVVAVLRSGSDYNHFYLHEAQMIKADANSVFKSNLGASTSVSATAKRPLLSNIFDKLQKYNSYGEEFIADAQKKAAYEAHHPVLDIAEVAPVQQNSVRFSLTISEDGETLYDRDGREIPVISAGLVKQNDIKEYKSEVRGIIKSLMKELIGTKVTVKADGRTVEFDSASAREFAFSNDTRRKTNTYLKAKFQTVEKVKEIIENAVEPQWEENHEEKHRFDAKRGWTKYRANFALSDAGNISMYDAELIIKMSGNSRDYFYDITKIEEGPRRQIRDFRPSNDKFRQPSSDESISSEANKNKHKISHQLNISEDDLPREDLIAENADLRRANEYLTGMLNTYKNLTPSDKDIHKVVKNLADEFNYSGDLKPLEAKVGKFYTYLRTAQRIDGEEVTRVSAALANEMLDKAEHTDPEAERVWKEFRKTMRSMRIYIPESNIADYAPDSWNTFRKEWFGKIAFTKNKEFSNGVYDGQAVYRRLQQQFPDYFTDSAEDMTDDEAIHRIMEAFELQKPMPEPVYVGADRDEVAVILGQRIIEGYVGVGNQDVRAQYNKSYKEITRQIERKIKKDYIEELSAQRIENAGELKKLNRRLQNQEIGLETYVVEKKALLDYAQQEKQAAAKRWRKMRSEYEDSQKKSGYKKEILRNTEKLTRMINQPTDKAHVPMFMLNDLKGVVDYISFALDPQKKDGQLKQWAQDGTTPKLMKSGADLKAAFARVTDGVQDIVNNGSVYIDGDGHEYYVVVDPDIITCLKQIPDMLTEEGAAAESLDKLSVYQMQIIRDTMASLNKMVEVAGQFISNEHYKSVNEAAEKTIDELSKMKSATNLQGKMLGGMQSMFRAGMVDAYTYFDAMGESGKAIYDEVRTALDKKIRNTRTAQDYMQEIKKREGITDKEINKWSTELKEIELVTRDRDGILRQKKTKVTDAQIMSLYLLNKRGQARMHIYGNEKDASSGGVKFSATKDGAFKETDSTTVYKMDEATVKRLIGQLTPKQIRLADAVGHFLTDVTSGWGNEVTMTLYGYKKFTASNYFPIDVDDNTIGVDSKALEGSITLLKNMGSTKSVQKKAYNPLILHDIFDVYTEQADKMGSYNAFVVATADMQKWFNYKTEETNVRQEVERALGKDANEYFMNLLRDVNGARAKADKYEWAYNLAGNAKAAAIGTNLRVAIQQPTAYARAAAEMDVKYLLKGLRMKRGESVKEWELCKKYAPIAQWKDWGYFDINTGRSMKSLILGSASALEDLKEREMWLAGKMDEVAWVRLWKASQEQVKDVKPELEVGSEEFYQEAGKVFGHLIDTTQVVDSVLHRTDMMKSKSAYVKGITAFLSEPMKSYNMVYREWMKAKRGDHGAKEKLAKVIAVYLISDTLTSAAASVMDAVRNADRDKGFLEKWFDAFAGDVLAAFTDPEMAFSDRVKIILSALADKTGVANIPVIKDIINELLGYSQRDMTMQGVENIISAVKETGKMASGESKAGPLGYVYKISSIGSLFGISARNFMKDVGGILNTFVLPAAGKMGITSENELRYKEKKLMSDILNNKKDFVEEAIRAYANGEKKLGDRIISEMIAEGIKEDYITEKISDALKAEPEYSLAVQAYMENDMTAYREYRQQLINSGYEEELVDQKIDSGTDIAFQDVATYQSIAEALDSGDRKAGNEAFRKMVEFKLRKSGDKKEREEIVKNVKGQVKAKITAMYRDEYKNNPGKRLEIQRKLNRILIEGHQLYTDDDYKKWRNEAAK